MTAYFYWRRNYLSSLHKIGDPEIEEIAKTSKVFAGMVAVHKRKDKTLVARHVFTTQFTLQWFMNYWCTRDRKFGAVSGRLTNFEKHLALSDDILKDCLAEGFLEVSQEYSNYIFITSKGEQFGASPIGLLREWAIYLGPIFSIGAGGIILEVVRVIATGSWW